jgi:SpoVK/Ycf46/Vps4 family AAA+-type ATPase
MPSSNQPTSKSRKLYSEDGLIKIGSSDVSMEQVILKKEIQNEVNSLIEEYQNKIYLKKFNLPVTNKVLFFGPSGCGKTLLATALSKQLKKPLFIINLSRIVDSGLGQTSTNISKAIEEAEATEAIIFFDEFDALGKKRTDENDHSEMRRVTSSLLQLMDHLGDNVFLIAATNHKELIDQAILRRFNKQIEFYMPTKDEIGVYMTALSKKAGLDIDRSTVGKLSSAFLGDSFATAKDKFLEGLKKFLLTHKDSQIKTIKNDLLKFIPSNSKKFQKKKIKN